MIIHPTAGNNPETCLQQPLLPEKFHEEILAKQRAFLDSLLDWLAEELKNPFPQSGGSYAVVIQQDIVKRINTVFEKLSELITAFKEDKLTRFEIIKAFKNILENINTIRLQRINSISFVTRSLHSKAASNRLIRQQKEHIVQLEKDIIYLDDFFLVS